MTANPSVPADCGGTPTPEAIALYRAKGYAEIDRYNDNADTHHWFEEFL